MNPSQCAPHQVCLLFVICADFLGMPWKMRHVAKYLSKAEEALVFLAFCELCSTKALKKSPSNTRQKHLYNISTQVKYSWAPQCWVCCQHCCLSRSFSQSPIYICVCVCTNLNLKMYHLTGLLYSPRTESKVVLALWAVYKGCSLGKQSGRSSWRKPLWRSSVVQREEQGKSWGSSSGAEPRAQLFGYLPSYLEPSPLLRA